MSPLDNTSESPHHDAVAESRARADAAVTNRGTKPDAIEDVVVEDNSNVEVLPAVSLDLEQPVDLNEPVLPTPAILRQASVEREEKLANVPETVDEADEAEIVDEADTGLDSLDARGERVAKAIEKQEKPVIPLNPYSRTTINATPGKPLGDTAKDLGQKSMSGLQKISKGFVGIVSDTAILGAKTKLSDIKDKRAQKNADKAENWDDIYNSLGFFQRLSLRVTFAGRDYSKKLEYLSNNFSEQAAEAYDRKIDPDNVGVFYSGGQKITPKSSVKSMVTNKLTWLERRKLSSIEDNDDKINYVHGKLGDIAAGVYTDFINYNDNKIERNNATLGAAVNTDSPQESLPSHTIESPQINDFKTIDSVQEIEPVKKTSDNIPEKPEMESEEPQASARHISQAEKDAGYEFKSVRRKNRTSDSDTQPAEDIQKSGFKASSKSTQVEMLRMKKNAEIAKANHTTGADEWDAYIAKQKASAAPAQDDSSETTDEAPSMSHELTRKPEQIVFHRSGQCNVGACTSTHDHKKPAQIDFESFKSRREKPRRAKDRGMSFEL